MYINNQHSLCLDFSIYIYYVLRRHHHHNSKICMRDDEKEPFGWCGAHKPSRAKNYLTTI